ncbi:MAG: hypothetical protein AAGI88_19060 [Pseudomonadota bacterium]
MKRFLEEWRAKLLAGLAGRTSRRGGLIHRLCRRVLDRALRLPPDDDFMRDEWIDNDVGFDPEELERYQKGEH